MTQQKLLSMHCKPLEAMLKASMLKATHQQPMIASLIPAPHVAGDRMAQVPTS